MLRNVIAFCLSRRPLVLISFAAFLGLGYAAFTVLNIEAYPDPAPPIIEIIAQYPGQSPEEMERYVTIPIEIAIASTPGLKYLRSNTVYALSFIRLQFEYGRDYHFVRQQTINRLKDAVLPPNVQPVISPAGCAAAANAPSVFGWSRGKSTMTGLPQPRGQGRMLERESRRRDDHAQHPVTKPLPAFCPRDALLWRPAAGSVDESHRFFDGHGNGPGTRDRGNGGAAAS